MNTSTDYNIAPKGNDNRRNIKFAVLAGVLAFGLLAAALTGSQMLSVAAAQTGGGTDKQASPSYNGTNNTSSAQSTVSTSGTATTKVSPDKFSVTVGVETNGTTAQEAASKNADLMANVISGLKELGIQQNQISTSNYNVYPIYDTSQPTKACPEIYPQPPYCQPGQIITGYRASNSVTVTLDVKGGIDAGKVIDASTKAGANNVNGVYFFISQEIQQEVRDNLTKIAISNAKHRAEIAVGALDMKISGVQSVNLNDVYFPIYSKNYDAAQMAAGAGTPPTQILPGEQDVSTNVSIVFYISANNTPTTTPSGMLKTINNTNCTNPPNGPMIC